MVEKNFNTNVSSGSPSALVTQKDTRVSAKSQFSYFTNITITTKKSRALNVSPPKVRIKIPKLLVKKSLKKKKESQSNSTNASNNNNNNGSSSSSCTKKCRSPKKLFPNKITLFFSNVLGNKKLETGCINEKNNSSNRSDISGNVSRNAEESCYHSRCIEKKAMIFNENGVDDESDIFQTSSISNTNKGGQKTSTACELPLKESSSFSSFFKRTPLNFMKGAKSITTTSMSSRRTSSIIGSSSGYLDIEKDEQSCKSSWVQARFRVNNKLMKSRSSRETASRGTMETDEEDEGDKELCKRRILMGERCRPLNLPDSFHCDESGNPLSEPTITEK